MCRREEINKKRELEMQARTKKLEIGLVARITHHAKLFNFLKTAAGPAVLWLPAHVSSGMQQLLDDRQADFQTWQVCPAVPGDCSAVGHWPVAAHWPTLTLRMPV